MSNLKVSILFLLVFSFSLSHASQVKLPDGISFMGLAKDNSWYGYVYDKGSLKKYAELKNAQEFTFSSVKNLIYFISAENKVFLFDIEKNVISEIELSGGVSRLAGIKTGYSRLGNPGFYGVSLIGGNSKHTEVVFYDSLSKQFEVLLSPRLSVYDPMISNGQIVYTAITCVESCEQPTQELWIKHLESNNARQLTLFSSFIKAPFLSKKEGAIYFSMPLLDSTNIWKHDLLKNKAEQITSEDKVKDSNPAWSDGKLYFVRQINAVSGIYVIVSGKAEKIEIPGVSKIRDFEVKND